MKNKLYCPKLIIKNIKKKPKLSLCIPTLNRDLELTRLLKSIRKDLNEYVEIVVCDDNKSNVSINNFKKFSKTLNFQFQYFKGDACGVDLTNLFLLKQSRGEFVWWLGDDDIIVNDGLKNILEFLEKNKKFSFIWINFCFKNLKNLACASHSRNFKTAEDLLITLGHNLGLMSTYLINRKLALKHLNYGYSNVKGFAFAATAVVIKTVVEEGNSFLLSGPYLMNNPSKIEDLKKLIIDDKGIVNNGAFKTYGIYFKEIIDGCKHHFTKISYLKIMSRIFRPVWKGIFVAWVGGWDDPRGKKKEMFKLYWYLPECWIAILLFSLPKFFNVFIYKLYKKINKEKFAS